MGLGAPLWGLVCGCSIFKNMLSLFQTSFEFGNLSGRLRFLEGGEVKIIGVHLV